MELCSWRNYFCVIPFFFMSGKAENTDFEIINIGKCSSLSYGVTSESVASKGNKRIRYLQSSFLSSKSWL